MHVCQASPLHRAMPFFVAFILCHGSIGLCQTEETKTELTGTILCDHPISFEDVTLVANYAGFRKKYSARSAPANKAEELPPSIPVDALVAKTGSIFFWVRKHHFVSVRTAYLYDYHNNFTDGEP